MGENRAKTPWRDGNYKSVDTHEIQIIKGEKAINLNAPSFEVTFKHGAFGEADDKIVEMTGEKYYTVESRFNVMEKDIIDLGVVVENGTKFVFKSFMGIRTLEWITDEEAEKLVNDGDPIDAPTSPYKVEPERQGRLIWITGPPGLGKSTSAQLLSREHGYVYYEADCFLSVKNPYIPCDVENPSLAQMHQRKLIGEGEAERRVLAGKAWKVMGARMQGKECDMGALEEAFGEMFKDVKRERTRLGGDWALAGVLDTKRLREIARAELGEDLEIVMLEMTPDQQEARLRARHEGSEDIVDMLKVFYDLFEPVGEAEPNTVALTVAPEMTPRQSLVIGEGDSI